MSVYFQFFFHKLGRIFEIDKDIFDTVNCNHKSDALQKNIINLLDNYVSSNNGNNFDQSNLEVKQQSNNKSAKEIAATHLPIDKLPKLIYKEDDPIIKNKKDFKNNAGKLAPIIPILYNYNPRLLIYHLKKMLNEKLKTENPPLATTTATITERRDYLLDGMKYQAIDEIKIVSPGKFKTRLVCLGMPLETYKTKIIKSLVRKCRIQHFEEVHKENNEIGFKIYITPAQRYAILNDSLINFFQLQSGFIPLNSNCLNQQSNGDSIKHVRTLTEVLEEFYYSRLHVYEQRKMLKKGLLEAKAHYYDAKALFCVMNFEFMKRKTKPSIAIAELRKNGFLPNPLEQYKRQMLIDDDSDGDDNDDRDICGHLNEYPEAREYHYLLNISSYRHFEGYEESLITKRNEKLTELAALQAKRIESMWLVELEQLDAELKKIGIEFDIPKASPSCLNSNIQAMDFNKAHDFEKQSIEPKAAIQDDLTDNLNVIIKEEEEIHVQKLSEGECQTVKEEVDDEPELETETYHKQENCNLSPAAFVTRHQLLPHKRSKMYLSKRTQMKYQFRQSVEKRFVCAFCFQKFSHSEHLNAHLQYHRR